jgi:hypothetical protein
VVARMYLGVKVGEGDNFRSNLSLFGVLTFDTICSLIFFVKQSLRSYGLSSEQLGGWVRSHSAFRDNLGRFLPGYGFFAFANVQRRFNFYSMR